MFIPGFGLMEAFNASMSVLGALQILRPTTDGQRNQLNDFVVKQIFPGIFGFDWKDEAIFNATASKLDEVSYLNLVEMMNTELSVRKRARMVLVMALMPDPDDRIQTLQRLANLPPEDFLKAAESLRLVPMDLKAIRKTRELLQSLGYADDDGKILWDKLGGDTYTKLTELSARVNVQLNIWGEELQTRAAAHTARADALRIPADPAAVSMVEAARARVIEDRQRPWWQKFFGL